LLSAGGNVPLRAPLTAEGSVASRRGATEERKVVYLVPDLPTFVYYLSTWDGDKRFPIFMVRNKYFEKFVRAYQADAIVTAKARKLRKVDEEVMRAAVYASWGKETIADLPRGVPRGKAGLKERLGRLGGKPRGIVLTEVDAPQGGAGLALAAGHRQLLDFLPVPSSVRRMKPSPPESGVSFEEKEEIRKRVTKTIEGWGYRYEELGDDIDYITLALDLPIAYIGSAAGGAGKQKLCLDDGINRLTPDGSAPSSRKGEEGKGHRYAFVGRLLEAEEGMALYQAMCSIFLGTSKALYFDRWPERWGLRAQEGWWVMQTKVNSVLVKKDESSLARWKRAVGSLNPYGFVHVSSAGNAREWGDGKVSDIPESVPTIVYFAHSFSASDPYDETTIAGQWLRAGAYVYYGAISEPYAQSFDMPRSVAVAAVGGEPLGKAFQAKEMLPTRFSFPWKQVYIGDPLHRMVFLEDRTESREARRFREAVRMIREMKLGQAIELLEEVLESAEDAAERDRVWRVLNKSFRLRFFAIRTGRLPIEEHVDLSFVDYWYNDTCQPNGEPTAAVVVNKRLSLFERELVRLYESLYRTIENRPRLTELLRREIAEMKRGAAFVKIWICVGPFEREEDLSPDNPFHLEKALRLGATWQAKAGEIRWQPGIVNPDDNYLDLSALYGKSESVIYAACFPVVTGEEAVESRLGVSATDRAEVWLNNALVGAAPRAGEKGSREGSVELKLQPGENLLVLKVFRRGDPAKAGLTARLTGGGGEYLEGVEYADPVAKLSAAGVEIDPERWQPER